MREPMFIEHRGCRVLFLDLSFATPREHLEALERSRRLIASEPPGPVLLLADVTGLHLGEGSATAVRAFAAENRDRIARTALVGVRGMKRMLLALLCRFGRANLRLFDDLGDARDWLAS